MMGEPKCIQEGYAYIDDESEEWCIKEDAPEWAKKEFKEFFALLNQNRMIMTWQRCTNEFTEGGYMAQSNKFYKNNPDDKIWWLDDFSQKGEWVFSFDKKETFNMFADYPHKLTSEQKEVFDEENPYWANFFKDRT